MGKEAKTAGFNLQDGGTFKIDKKVPIPPKPPKKPKPPPTKNKYPWLELNIGESFFVPGKGTPQISPCAALVQRVHKRKFTCRAENGGCRVWRIE